MSRFYYLQEPVELVEELDDGWCKARDSKGRIWRQWRAQLRDKPLKPPPRPRFVILREHTSDTPPHSYVAWVVWDRHEDTIVGLPRDDFMFASRVDGREVMPEWGARLSATDAADKFNVRFR